MGLLAKIFRRNKGCILSRKSGATKKEISSSAKQPELEAVDIPSSSSTIDESLQSKDEGAAYQRRRDGVDSSGSSRSGWRKELEADGNGEYIYMDI